MVIRPVDTLLALKAINLMPDLRANDRSVAATLIEHFNRKTGQCDPSLERIAGLLGISERTVIRAIKRLEAAGVFRKTRHGGHLNRNSYEPVWSTFDAVLAAWKARFKRSKQCQPSKLSHASGQSCHLQHDTAVTQTYKSNLLKETCSKRQPTEERRGDLVKRTNTTQSSDAARAAAERRWSTALHERLVLFPVTYGEVLQVIDAAMQSAATEAELHRPGAGLEYIFGRLKLRATDFPTWKEAGHGSFQADLAGGGTPSREFASRAAKKLG
jgi:biotin operon repressor